MSVLTDLQEELIQVKTAISYLMQGGAEYTINTRNTQRSFKSADLPSLQIYRNELESKISTQSQTRGTRVQPGW